MPVAPTYPGVYVEEIPSGVRTITGVATSIAAFAGWAARGPTDRAQRILSWEDFNRQFGGLDVRSLLGYSVYHFFANGGTQAYVVRLAAGDAAAATVTVDGKLAITAKNSGAWTNTYSIKTKTSTFDSSRFRVEVVNANGAPVETFENLSMNPADRRYVKSVIDNESTLISVTSVTGMTPPADPTPAIPPPTTPPGPTTPTVTPPGPGPCAGYIDHPPAF